MDWVEAGGDVVVWTDAKYEASDGGKPPPWKMFAASLPPTHASLVLVDSSDQSGVDFEPLPRGSSEGVAWTTHRGNVDSVKLLMSRHQMRQLHNVVARDVGIEGDDLVYTSSHDGGRVDLFTRAIAGGTPRQLSESGEVFGARVGDGVAVWQEPITGETEGIWLRGLRSGAPKGHEVVQDAGSSNPVPGRCFIAYMHNSQAVLADTAGRWRQRLGTAIDIPCRIAARGNLVAWCAEPPQGKSLQPDRVFIAHVSEGRDGGD